MKRSAVTAIVVCLLLCLGLNIGRAIYRKSDSNSLNTLDYTESPEYNTAYPDSVVVSDYGIITVEDAEADLRDYIVGAKFEDAMFEFDRLTFEYPDYDSFVAIFWFDVSLPNYEEYYRMTIKYQTNDAFGRLDLKDVDMW